MEKTLFQSLKMQGTNTPNAPALAAPNRSPLSYAQLCEQGQRVVAVLNQLRIGRNDRVALVLPDGPEMVVAFCAVATGAAAAPLNPAYRESEFEFYLSDLQAKAVVVLSNVDSPARQVAQKLAIPVLELTPSLSEPAGIFTLSLSGELLESASEPLFSQADDLGFVLHTSGTTARPKLVPCTQTNLMAGASLTGQAYNLGTNDRYLCIMPMTHTHALITMLTTLVTGGTLFATPKFEATQFFDWFKAFDPTWYSAAPTLHQAILQQAPEHLDILSEHSLRF
ncbi:MAG: AMP-binding protein, partial [Chloroflexota bacterium]